MEQNAMSIFSYEFLLGKQSYFERETKGKANKDFYL